MEIMGSVLSIHPFTKTARVQHHTAGSGRYADEMIYLPLLLVLVSGLCNLSGVTKAITDSKSVRIG
jgi:hypothetical protein